MGELPDETTGFDEPGPYVEVPSEEEAEQPRQVQEGWENATDLQAAAYNSWGRSFCETHHVGCFCDGQTRVRCCRNTWGFVKCGSTVHSRSCGWTGGDPWGPSTLPWRPSQPGWHETSFYRSHSVGFFCYQHHKVHCCNDRGHYVDCSTSQMTSWRCLSVSMQIPVCTGDVSCVIFPTF